MGLFDGGSTCRFLLRKETETVHHIICCCEASVRQRYNVFGNLFIEPKDISTASVMELCLFIKGTGLLNLS
jgi:ferredoxin-thioredoxin reductase catalytic subunit